MLVGGIMGNILWDIPFVAIMVLMASLMEVFLIMPAHLRSAFSHQVQQVTPRWRQRVDTGFDHFRDRWYRPVVAASLRWRGVTVSAVAVMMILSVGLLAGGRIAFVFFPTPEAQIVFANATFVAGTPREQTAAFLDELKEGLRLNGSWAAAWWRPRSRGWGPRWRWTWGPAPAGTNSPRSWSS